jgi:hypothetical protein
MIKIGGRERPVKAWHAFVCPLPTYKSCSAISTPLAPFGSTGRAAAGGRIALDRVLSEYAPKLREAVIELRVFNWPVDWTFYPEIRRLLDRVSALWPDARQADGSKLPRRSILRGTPALHRALMRRRRRAADDIHGPDGTELRSDLDADAADIEAIKKLFAKLLPDLDADGMARLIDEWVTLRDREVFRQEKKNARQ